MTPGIVELMGVSELSGWLAIRQHDLIEEAIGKLLDCVGGKGEECEVLGDAPKPWKTIEVMKSLSEVSEKVSDVRSAVEYFAGNYGEKLASALKVFNNKCWKRAAFIIGAALAGHPIVPRPEDLPNDVVESLGDILRECGVDDYLLVGNVIPPLIWYLTYTRASTEAFIDKYNEAVAEVRRILNIARGRGGISPVEGFYGLGLVSIIAKAAESGKPIEPGNADVVLHFASFAIQRVVLPDFIGPLLGALEPLRGKAPHRYLGLLFSASNMENLDRDTVEYILGELNYVLNNYGDVVKRYAWSLMYAIRAYANLLRGYLVHFSYGEIGDVVGRVVDLLNELGKFKSSLGVIAWAYALGPALAHGIARVLMEMMLGIDAVSKASEVLEELNKLRGKVPELMSDKEFMGYVKSKSVKANEETVKKEILRAASFLKYALAHYWLHNDELDEAAKLFNETAEEDREIGVYGDYLIARGWALRVKAIKGSLLVDEFGRLYEEAFNEEYFMPTARYLSIASSTLGDYLVSLALTGDHEKINKLLEEHWWVLNADRRASVLTRLTLNALLGSRVELSGELEGRLAVEPRELIDAFESDMHSEFLPALRVAFGIAKLEDGIKSCEKFNDEDCVDSVLAVKGNSAAFEQLRKRLIDNFQELLNAKFSLLKRFGVDTNKLFDEFRGLVNKLNGEFLVQLNAPRGSMAWLALMLYALINGDERLAKAHALYGAVDVGEKLPTRLFLEAYRACCDLGKDEFRRAIAKLFFLHV